MRVRMRERVVVSAIVAGVFACGGVARAQENGAAVEMVSLTMTVRGRVVNQVTKEPIGRALVTTTGDEYAVMADDRGQFEMKMHKTFPKMLTERTQIINEHFEARKPGFLPMHRVVMVTFASESTAEQHGEVTIPLVPEALIVGHVDVPGTEGEVRIQCELYRRDMEQGRENWHPVGSFTTWADGEFRFSELRAGTYKLITHEQMDRDSLMAMPGAELFGYPPIYYPNTTDFSLASPIELKAGATAKVNLTVERRAYYPVQIPVRNAAGPGGMDVLVYPMGHWGPGWSLGYNPMEQAIVGMLPDGSYTVEAEAMVQTGATGIANFTVRGAPLEGAPLHLVPNTSVTVNVRTEFQHGQTEFERGNAEGAAGVRPVNVGVTLWPMEEFGGRSGRAFAATSVEGTGNRTLVIDNVKPGRYGVSASGDGYVASIESGGSDLMKQPLVVGMGGGVPPIEVTLRDDGAEVSGTVEGMNAEGTPGKTKDSSQFPFICLLPIGQGQRRQVVMLPAWNGTFQLMQVPPGDYLLLAYEEEQRDPPSGDEEFLKKMEGKGKVIHVEAGQKVSVKVKVIAGSEEE